jgi:hypothetical protein
MDPNNLPGADEVKSTARVVLGPVSTANLMNAPSPSEIIFSNSSTQLAKNLARALEPSKDPTNSLQS